jgi:TIR domain/Restriction endonuclease
MTRVFLAYSHHEDRDLVEALRTSLRSDRTFELLDPADPEERIQDIFSSVRARIQQSDVVIALLTLDRPNVLLEAGIALGSNKNILLVASSTKELPANLQFLPFVSRTGDIGTDAAEIARRVKAIATSQLRNESKRPASLDDFEVMDPAQFESLVAQWFREHGLNVSEVRADDGVDFLIQDQTSQSKIAVQVKKRSRESRISIDEVRELLGAAITLGAKAAIFISSSPFTAAASEMAAMSVAPRLVLMPIGQLLKLETATAIVSNDLMAATGWPQRWLALSKEDTLDAQIVELGYDWLERAPRDPAWPFVWQRLLEFRSKMPQLLPMGRDWLQGNEEQPEWTFVWQRLVELGFENDRLLPIGRDWLQGHEERPDWAFVWRRLVELGFESERLLPIGRDWLQGHEERTEWAFLWECLVEFGFENDRLLPIGRDWLQDHEEKAEWGRMWMRLVELGFERERLLPIGRDWLEGHEEKPEWAFVWQRLVELGFEADRLLPIGRDWLQGHEERPEWAFVWQRLVELGFEADRLFPIGRDWLQGHEEKPEWAFVWQRLVELGFESDRLLPIGRDWLQGREGQQGYHQVYRYIYGPRTYSCFISYSTRDQDFAERLYADLQANGVRCWFAPHHVQAGRMLHEQIDAAIHLHERLLLILSPDSINSEWVKAEIAKARQREVEENKRVLFPIRIGVSYDELRHWEYFDSDVEKNLAKEIREYYIPDFSAWKSHDAYQEEFAKLLRDLKKSNEGHATRA